jgi:hypothetical protein
MLGPTVGLVLGAYDHPRGGAWPRLRVTPAYVSRCEAVAGASVQAPRLRDTPDVRVCRDGVGPDGEGGCVRQAPHGVEPLSILFISFKEKSFPWKLNYTTPAHRAY